MLEIYYTTLFQRLFFLYFTIPYDAEYKASSKSGNHLWFNFLGTLDLAKEEMDKRYI